MSTLKHGTSVRVNYTGTIVTVFRDNTYEIEPDSQLPGESYAWLHPDHFEVIAPRLVRGDIVNPAKDPEPGVGCLLRHSVNRRAFIGRDITGWWTSTGSCGLNWRSFRHNATTYIVEIPPEEDRT
jgi:hypothetical protein